MTGVATDYRDGIRACVTNGKRLLEDAESLRDWERYGTSLALTILAEEEFAKAFLLYLIQDQAVPSTSEVLRALRDHHCKHLLTVFMEYLDAGDGLIAPRVDAQYDPERRLPNEVASAVNLFRHQRIHKWEDPHSEVLEPEDYDVATERLPNDIDLTKQNAIYVRIARNGCVVSTPLSVTEDRVTAEMDKCSRLRELAMQVEGGYVLLDRDYERLKDALTMVFTPPVRNDVGEPGEVPGLRFYSEEWQLVTLQTTKGEE